ncbi:MAG: hypothetical protein Q9221_007391 [Calogaya cf. arnoldii]
MAATTPPNETLEHSKELYQNIINAIPVVENLYKAPSNDQRYKILNRYRVQLRRLNELLEERKQKVHTLFEHSHIRPSNLLVHSTKRFESVEVVDRGASNASREFYGSIETILKEPIRILEPWIVTVDLMFAENTNMWTIQANIEASTAALNGGVKDGK